MFGMGDLKKKADEEAKKLREKQAALELAKQEEQDKVEITNRVMTKYWGEPLFFIDGRSANLWVYEDKIVLDRCKGGFFNAFNHGVKVIPTKQITTLQFKNKGITLGAIEFGVSGYDSASNMANVAVNFVENENCFAFNSRESQEEALKAYMYLVGIISQR